MVEISSLEAATFLGRYRATSGTRNAYCRKSEKRGNKYADILCLIIVGGMTPGFLEVGCRYFSQLLLKSYYIDV